MKSFLRICILVLVVSPAMAADLDADSSQSARRSPGVDLHNVIAAVGQKTHRRFLLDPRVAGNVELIGLEPRDLTYANLMSILQVHGYATYEQDGVVVVVPETSIRQMGMEPVAAGNVRGPDAEIVTTIVPVRNLSAAQLVPVLRPLMPQVANLAAVIGANAILITDRAGNVRRMLAIIETLDKLPGAKPADDKPQ